MLGFRLNGEFVDAECLYGFVSLPLNCLKQLELLKWFDLSPRAFSCDHLVKLKATHSMTDIFQRCPHCSSCSAPHTQEVTSDAVRAVGEGRALTRYTLTGTPDWAVLFLLQGVDRVRRHVCPDCGQERAVFASDRGRLLASSFHVVRRRAARGNSRLFRLKVWSANRGLDLILKLRECAVLGTIGKTRPAHFPWAPCCVVDGYDFVHV